MAQKRFQTEHAGSEQRLNLFEVVRHDAAIKSAIHPQLTLGGNPLSLQGRGGCCDRRTIQRHVDQGRDATGRGGAGGGRKTFPFGSSRFVDMHVCIDQAGQHRQPAQIITATSVGQLLGWKYGDDLVPSDQHRRRDRSLWSQDAFAADSPIARLVCNRLFRPTCYHRDHTYV